MNEETPENAIIQQYIIQQYISCVADSDNKYFYTTPFTYT